MKILSASVSSKVEPGVFVPVPHPPEWLLDNTLLKSLYDKVQWYRAKGKPSKRKRLECIETTPSFDHWTACQVTSIGLEAFGRPGEVGWYISFGDIETIRRATDFYFRIDDQLRVLTAPWSARTGYDGSPLVSRHWHKLRVFVKATPIVMYWMEETAKRIMRAEFASDGTAMLIGPGAIAEQEAFRALRTPLR